MIANLITTLMLALGVATGNVSSNVYKGGNAFNNVVEKHKKPIKKAIDNVTIEYNWVSVNSYEDNSVTYTKYYLNNSLNNNALIGNIYASAYTSGKTDTGTVYARLVNIMHITPYRNLINNTFTLETMFRTASSTTESLHLSVWQYATTQNLDEYIDLTIYNADQLYEEIQIDNNKLINNTFDQTNTDNYPTNWQWQYLETEIDITSLQNDIWVYQKAVAYNNLNGSQAKVMQIAPHDLKWYGEYLQENYEVVDIPNLMFTILTLPFAWYSTAFNLTIFPNTPYALNFGNLILTIVGALILLYLIKKVFK